MDLQLRAAIKLTADLILFELIQNGMFKIQPREFWLFFRHIQRPALKQRCLQNEMLLHEERVSSNKIKKVLVIALVFGVTFFCFFDEKKNSIPR